MAHGQGRIQRNGGGAARRGLGVRGRQVGPTRGHWTVAGRAVLQSTGGSAVPTPGGSEGSRPAVQVAAGEQARGGGERERREGERERERGRERGRGRRSVKCGQVLRKPPFPQWQRTHGRAHRAREKGGRGEGRERGGEGGDEESERVCRVHSVHAMAQTWRRALPPSLLPRNTLPRRQQHTVRCALSRRSQ